jgi:hypothetical protein
MSDPLNEFEGLARRARGDSPPPVDVTAGVLRELRTAAPRRLGDGVMWAIGGAALLAACVTLVLGIGTYETLTDPLAGLLEPLSVVLQ